MFISEARFSKVIPELLFHLLLQLQSIWSTEIKTSHLSSMNERENVLSFVRTSSTFQENNNQVSDPLCPYIDVYCCLVMLLSFPVETLNWPHVCIFVHTVETELLRWFMQERAQNIRKSERRKGHFSEDLVLDCETIF